MICQQLGGPCTVAFHAHTADEAIKAQDAHLKAMVEVGDTAHETALKEMKARWRNPIKGMGWYRHMKKDFAALKND
jgi:hypothetical protein